MDSTKKTPSYDLTPRNVDFSGNADNKEKISTSKIENITHQKVDDLQLQTHQKHTDISSLNVKIDPTDSHTLKSMVNDQHQKSIEDVKHSFHSKFTKEKVIEDLKHAPTDQAWRQILAHSAVYFAWKIGEEIPRRNNDPNAPVFVVDSIIDDKQGFHALVVVTKDAKDQKNTPPMMLFRGTDPSNKENILDDLSRVIGLRSVARNETKILKILEKLSKKYGRVDLLGHSLGGSIAQILTAKYPHLIKSCTHYNAPGIGVEAVKEFFKNVKNVSPKPDVISVRHVSDTFFHMGGVHMPANKTYILGDRIEDALEAHSLITFAAYTEEVAPTVLTKHNIQDLKNWKERLEQVENVRQVIGDAIVATHDVGLGMINYLRSFFLTSSISQTTQQTFHGIASNFE